MFFLGFLGGADGGGRTHTLLRVPDFESSASANSATSAADKRALRWSTRAEPGAGIEFTTIMLPQPGRGSSQTAIAQAHADTVTHDATSPQAYSRLYHQLDLGANG